jgi:protein-tyrosine phosphatase
MARVMFVCLGNICRSPMAEGILLARLAERGLGAGHEVASAGTAGHHAGELPDPRTIAVLARRGERCPSRAAQVQREDFERYDLLLAMDRSNLAELVRRCPPAHRHKLRLMLELTGGGEVPDPYYGGPEGFEQVYALLDRAVAAWLDELSDR